MYTIYHNPNCSKSRAALDFLKEMKVEFKVVDYQKNIPTAEDLDEVLKKLGMEPSELIRKGETQFKNELKGKDFSKSQWIKIMQENPKLIERPIVIKGSKAVVARPAELINLL